MMKNIKKELCKITLADIIIGPVYYPVRGISKAVKKIKNHHHKHH